MYLVKRYLGIRKVITVYIGTDLEGFNAVEHLLHKECKPAKASCTVHIPTLEGKTRQYSKSL